MIAPVKTPLVAKKMFPNYVWDVATNDKVIYLTFDDGPTPDITPWTLETLKSYQAKATFFCIGNNAEKHPNILKTILDEGHRIGNHTQDHLKGWKTKTEAYIQNTTKAQEVITTQMGHVLEEGRSKLFRPPYGKLKPKQGKKLMGLGYKIVMWDVLSFDWNAKLNGETCLHHVLQHTVSGSIVVFHDSIKASKNMQFVLPKVLEHFSEKGYRFEAIH